MAKYYGTIGFALTEETKPGVWEEIIKERDYLGELIRNLKQLQTGEGLNDDINIANEISIIADPYAIQNFSFIRYATFMGVKWKVKSVEFQHPRLILSLGGVYNADSPT